MPVFTQAALFNFLKAGAVNSTECVRYRGEAGEFLKYKNAEEVIKLSFYDSDALMRKTIRKGNGQLQNRKILCEQVFIYSQTESFEKQVINYN